MKRNMMVFVGLLVIVTAMVAQETHPSVIHMDYFKRVGNFADVTQHESGEIVVFRFEEPFGPSSCYGRIEYYQDEVSRETLIYSVPVTFSPQPYGKRGLSVRSQENRKKSVFYEVDFLQVPDGTIYTFLYNPRTGIPEIALIPIQDGVLD